MEDSTSAVVRGSERMTINADQRVRPPICQCALEEVSMEEHKSWKPSRYTYHPNKLKGDATTHWDLDNANEQNIASLKAGQDCLGQTTARKRHKCACLAPKSSRNRAIWGKKRFSNGQQTLGSKFRRPGTNFKYISATFLRQLVITSHPRAFPCSYLFSSFNDSGLQSTSVAKMDGRLAVK